VIDDWDSFCDVWFQVEDGGVFDFDGHDVCVFPTQWGDGSYGASDGSILGVDAGLIGAIPLVLMTRGGEEDGVCVTFDKPFECRREPNGRLWFGDLHVMTGDDE